MANTTYTNLTALEAVAELEAVQANKPLAEKIAAMVKAEQKKREHAAKNRSTNSKQKRLTRANVVRIMRAIVDNGNEPVTTSWIGEHVPDMLTPQKVSGTLATVRDEQFISIEKIKGKAYYQVTDKGIEALAHPETLELADDAE